MMWDNDNSFKYKLLQNNTVLEFTFTSNQNNKETKNNMEVQINNYKNWIEFVTISEEHLLQIFYNS